MPWSRFLRLGRWRKSPAPSSRDVEDWVIGDLAECILPGPWRTVRGDIAPGGPTLGELRVVTAVHLLQLGPLCTQILTFARYAPARYGCGAFRKVTPRADALVRGEAGFLTHRAPPTPVRPERVDAHAPPCAPTEIA